MDENKEMFDKLVKGLRDIYGDILVRVLLYGSFARKTNTQESDIDIAVLLDGEETKDMHNRMVNLAVDMDLEYDQVFSVLNIDYKNFLEWEDTLPFYKNVKEEGVVLWAA
ncbi:nucleotidyltransferase domain-containing protein [Lachnoclostridium pacaense]|uniref:nucleotidyltransferase domain-containing protein n=1 Tax=Enterocloster hominis (ex Hitch et al. 2024) TaxID=1917870 RepID=UPI001D127060|nr:nucleotidyltransferase domain-containing protein [Lachnoclostridium pacaense]MCC2876109.1 nucleotidyltransferase domain-containing protein [Lachnoclostridium pacaense]